MIFKRKSKVAPTPEPLSWEDSEHLISLPPDISIPKYAVTVEGRPDLDDDTFDTHQSAALYVTFIQKKHKVAASINPL